MKVLGIETSCDETGIAVYDTTQGLLSQVLHTQIPLHAEYGGVVPELASRDHVRKIIPLIESALQQADLTKHQLDGIAYTAGPGLLGALMVGAAVAQSMAFALKIPAIGVHHMEGHLLAPMLAPEPPEFPFVALLVSGGHTQLMQVNQLGDYQLLGESIDDAAGEAFDKTAKMMGLPYPGGPALAQLASQGQASQYHFPRPMTDRPGLMFSFSGLKTAALNAWQQSTRTDQTKADIAFAFQAAVVDTLLIKCRRALQQTGLQRLVVAGGVSANQQLRQQLDQLASAHGWQVYYPPLALCTDNGAMIAYAGAMRLLKGQRNNLAIEVKARWDLSRI